MITFTRQQESSQLYFSSDIGCDVTIAFYYQSVHNDNPAPGGSISLADSWEKYKGYYLIVDSSASTGNIESNISTLINGRTDTQTGFLWFRYDGTDFHEVGTVRTQRSEPDPPPQGEQPVVATVSEVLIRFGGYRLPFGAGTRIVYRNSGNPTGFVFEYPAAPTNRIPEDAILPDPDPDGNIQLPFEGDEMGCFQWMGFIGDFWSTCNTSWDVALRYVVPVDGSPVHQFYPIFDMHRGRGPLLWMCWDPVHHLDTNRTYLSFLGKNIQITVEGEGCTPACIRMVGDGGALPTYFRTVTGEIVGFIPRTSGADRAKLVFERKTPVNAAPADTCYYLVPCGAFELTLVDGNGMPLNVIGGDAENPSRLMCGLSGIESVEFMPRMACCPGDSIIFFPRMPAYVPSFPIFGQGITGAPGKSAADLIRNEYHTAWVGFVPSIAVSGSVYLSQPETGPLYSLAHAPKPGPGTELLGLNEPPAHALPAPDETHCFPVAPASGVIPAAGLGNLAATFVTRFEAQILSPYRREKVLRFFVPAQAPPTLPPNNVPPDRPGAPWFNLGLLEELEQYDVGYCWADILGLEQSTTPNGLIASIDGNYWWRLMLAQNSATGTLLQFCWLNTVLQAAFQTNQLFMVATNSYYLQHPNGTQFWSVVNLGDWSFDLDIRRNTFNTEPAPDRTAFSDLNNTVIFKFSPGRIIDRIKDTRAWTNPRDFNSYTEAKLTALSTRLQAFVDLALQKAAEPNAHKAYVKFKEIVEDPNWRGVLALNVIIDIARIPAELRVLAAGVHTPTFVAHHIAVETGSVDCAADGTIIPSEASICGLIDYVQPLPAQGASDPATTSDYYFAVKDFRVWFANSTVREFKCTAELTINSLFDEQVSRVEGGAAGTSNAIRMIGTRERHGNQDVYSFTVDGERMFIMNSKVIQHVYVRRTQFNSAQQPAAPGATPVILSTFAMFGEIKFKALEGGFDLFSYERLAFENLALDMVHPTPQPPAKKFTLVTERMTLDLSPGASQVRDDSLIQKFPMRLQGFVRGGQPKPADAPQNDPRATAQLPNKQDYVRVRAALGGDPIEWRWYGLDMELNLGSMGEFAANAGITVRLLLSWSPGADRTRAQVWLKFPGSGGVNVDLFALQGVIKVGASGYELAKFVREQAPRVSYMLRITNFGLRVLGIPIPLAGGPNVYIFGDPNRGAAAQQPAEEALGWLGVYRKNGNPQ